MNFSNPMQTDANAPRTTGAGFFPSSGFSRARFFILVLLSAFQIFSLSAFSANVRTYFINTFTGDRDTNYVVATKISSNILSSGGVIAQGIPTRLVMTNGASTNFFAAGFYSLVNSSLGKGVVINVSDNGSQLYDYTNLLYSGFNTYATVYGSNLPPTYDNVTNALGFLPLTPTQTTNAILQASNSITANLTNAINGTSNSITANMTNYVSGIAATLQAEIDAIDTGGGTNGGSATNVFFLAGQNTSVRTQNGSNVVDVVGTLTNNTTGNASTATTATNVATQTSVVNPAQYVWMASVGTEPNVGVTLVTSTDGTNFTRAQTPIIFNYDQYTNSYKGPSNRRWSLIETNGQWFSASAHDGRFGSASSGDIDIWRSGDLTNWTRAAVISATLGGAVTNITYGVNWYRDNDGSAWIIASTDTNALLSGSAHIWTMKATDSTLTNFTSPNVIKVGDVSQEGFMVRGTNGVYKLYYRCRWPGLEWLLATNSANNLTTIFSACQTNLGWGTFGASADAGGLSLVKVSGTHWRAYSYSESAGTNYFTDSFDDLATWANWSQLSGVPNYVTGESYSGVYGSGITLSPTSPAGATNRLQTLGSDTVYTSAIDSPLLKARTVNAGNVAVTGGGVFGSLFSAGTITGGGDVRAKHVRSSHFVSLSGDGTTVDAELLDGVWNAVGFVGIFVGDGSGITNISGGSSVTFNSTQFGSSAAGTNIVSGALTTNQFLYTATIKNTAPAAVEHGVQFTNSANNELKIVAAESGSTIATISEITGITGTHVGDGSGITGLNASALATGYVPRPVTNSAVKTGDLVVTNNATISGNISVAGTFNVNSTTTTNFTIINPWDGRLVTNNLIGVWTFGYQVAQTSAGVAMIPNAYGANFTAAGGATNIGVSLFRVPFNCYLSNLNVGYYNASGSSHVGSNYVVYVSTNSFLDTTSSTLIKNVVNAGMSFATNTGFSTALTKNQHVGFMIINTNAAHSPASQTLIGSIGVYSR